MAAKSENQTEIFKRALAHAALEDYQRALADCDQALRTNPTT